MGVREIKSGIQAVLFASGGGQPFSQAFFSQYFGY